MVEYIFKLGGSIQSNRRVGSLRLALALMAVLFRRSRMTLFVLAILAYGYVGSSVAFANCESTFGIGLSWNESNHLYTVVVENGDVPISDPDRQLVCTPATDFPLQTTEIVMTRDVEVLANSSTAVGATGERTFDEGVPGILLSYQRPVMIYDIDGNCSVAPENSEVFPIWIPWSNLVFGDGSDYGTAIQGADFYDSLALAVYANTGRNAVIISASLIGTDPYYSEDSMIGVLPNETFLIPPTSTRSNRLYCEVDNDGQLEGCSHWDDVKDDMTLDICGAGSLSRPSATPDSSLDYEIYNQQEQGCNIGTHNSASLIVSLLFVCLVLFGLRKNRWAVGHPPF